MVKAENENLIAQTLCGLEVEGRPSPVKPKTSQVRKFTTEEMQKREAEDRMVTEEVKNLLRKLRTPDPRRTGQRIW